LHYIHQWLEDSYIHKQTSSKGPSTKVTTLHYNFAGEVTKNLVAQALTAT